MPDTFISIPLDHALTVVRTGRTSAWPKRVKEKAAYLYTNNGNIKQTARLTGIPESTLYGWINGISRGENGTSTGPDEEWVKACERYRAEYETETLAIIRDVARTGYEQALDRIKHGDFVHVKDADGAQELVRQPMKGKDLAVTAAIAIDKLRVAEGKPTRITATTDALDNAARAFQQLASQYRGKVVSDQ